MPSVDCEICDVFGVIIRVLSCTFLTFVYFGASVAAPLQIREAGAARVRSRILAPTLIEIANFQERESANCQVVVQNDPLTVCTQSSGARYLLMV
jgi:hypothetical protein